MSALRKSCIADLIITILFLDFFLCSHFSLPLLFQYEDSLRDGGNIPEESRPAHDLPQSSEHTSTLHNEDNSTNHDADGSTPRIGEDNSNSNIAEKEISPITSAVPVDQEGKGFQFPSLYTDLS